MNVYTHSEQDVGIYEIYVSREGFDDGWTMFCHDGIYFEHNVTWQERQELEQRYGGGPWGRWDSAERLLYRGNSNVGLRLRISDMTTTTSLQDNPFLTTT